jgi:hypothetical protein
MELTRGRKSSNSSLPLWSRASTRLGIRRKSSSRPAISVPFGPVKNSRGPDLSRSDTLIIVDGIDDCAYSNLPSIGSESNVGRAVRAKPGLTAATKRLSASFPQLPSAASPTVAKSNITATTNCIQAPLNKMSVNELRKTSYPASPRPANRSGLKNGSTVSMLPHASQPLRHDQNTAPGPGSLRSKDLPKPRVGSRLPTSRTISNLQDLKDMVPHRLVVENKTSIVSDKSSQATSPGVITQMALDTDMRTPPSSQTSFLTHSVESIYQDFDPQLVIEAQPSAYWSGRFVSLHDKYSTESLAQRPSYCVVSSPDRQASYQRLPSSTRRNITGVPSRIALATTASALLELPQAAKPRLKPPPPPPARDDDAQSRRIFKRLQALCTTDEARESLFQWQQSYARRNNRPNLLPEGGTMSKGLVSKWFSSHGRKSGRRSLAAVKEGDSNHSSRKGKPRRPVVEMHHFRASLT